MIGRKGCRKVVVIFSRPALDMIYLRVATHSSAGAA
jgi:hypothetical protein